MITTDTHVYFWGGKCEFSNWHRRHKLILDPLNDDQMFDSSEQHFMWWKALFFGDMRICDLIAKQPDPAITKKLGREIKGYNDRLWSCVRLGYMTYSCYLKFSQNPDLKKFILDTGDRILVEASPLDKIWGIGIGEEDAAAGKSWNGQNLLGIALMDVRSKLKVDNQSVPG
jgi:ribA/ribD-fused uncharacterized protein